MSNVSLCVLIVDDSRRYIDAARGLLRRERVRAEAAFTIADALEQTERLRPDVVLADVMLAGESGVELARRLAEPDRVCRPPVILISTHTADDLEDLIAASPAIGFLPKAELSAGAIMGLLGPRSQR